MSPPINILLVEDNLLDRQVMDKAFKSVYPDGRMFTASDGPEALLFLSKMEKHQGAPRLDLVVLDLNIPKKDGIEVLAEIRKNESLKDLPIVVLTTSQWQADLEACQLLNANAFLTKPSHYSEILSLVQSLAQYCGKAVHPG